MTEPNDALPADRKKQQDFNDLQNELAGREVGRQARFGVGDGTGTARAERKERDRVWRDTLDRLLATDPEYRALYVELGDKLQSAERETDAEIAAIMARMDALQTEIDDMKRKAAVLPGTGRVYRFADGRVVNENGIEIDPAIAEGIIWPDDAPSAEAYFAKVDERKKLESNLAEWQDYSTDTLGGIRDRYDDRENPMTKEAIRDALDDVQAHRPELTSITALTEMPAQPEAPGTIATPTTLK